MDSKKWNCVKNLFNNALERDEKERDNWLRKECGKNEELYKEVSKLLRARKAASPIDKPLDKLPDTIFSPENIDDANRKVGNYRLLEVIGYGGMGVVYLAERVDGEFEQQVALKFLRFGMASKKLIRRFKKERQILAKLQHPSIARLYDGGVMKDGTPWFSMEYIEGLPVTEYAEKNRLTIKERLQLFRKICAAVLYAHQNLVIHRDLKPSNIMVIEDGEPILLDFGLARLEDETTPENQDITRSSQNWMTLEYASPEQVRGEKLTTASDVYQLGLVLHELLTGQRPYSVKGSTPSEAEQIICNTQPAKPSTSVKSLEETQASFTPAELQKVLKGDLDTIILKALEKDPVMRYSSVERMSDDIYRHLIKKPILARKPTFRYRAGKYIKRHSKTLTAATLLIIGLFILNAFYTNQLASERDTATREAERAEVVKDYLINLFTEADPYESPGEPITVRSLLEENTDEIIDQFTDQPEIALELLHVIANAQSNLTYQNQALATMEKGFELIESKSVEIEPAELAKYLTSFSNLHEHIETRFELLIQARNLVAGQPEDRFLLANIENGLAYISFTEGLYKEASNYIQNAIDLICSEDEIKEDPAFCISMHSDAYYFFDRAGMEEEAFLSAERGYKLLLEYFSDSSHPNYAGSAMAYASSLIDNQRPNDAINVLKNGKKMVESYYGPDNLNIAYLTYPQAIAESARGFDNIAVDLWYEALTMVNEREPNLGIPIQLNFLVERLLNLRRVEDAIKAYEIFEYHDPESIPHHGVWERKYNEVQIKLLSGESISQSEWIELAESFSNNYSQLLHFLKFDALENAIERNDLDSADYWVKRVQSNEDINIKNNRQALLAMIRYYLAQNSLNDAEELITKTQKYLMAREEIQGPRMAKLHALKAEKHCQIGESLKALEALQQAEQYWNQVEGHESGIQTLRIHAQSCFSN